MTKWPKGKGPKSVTEKLYASIQEASPLILEARTLVMDPSSKTLGYAIIEAGDIVASGTVDLGKEAVHYRMQKLGEYLQNAGCYDVLLVERIRGQMAHAYLSWSVGAILANTTADIFLEMPISVWKAHAGKEHVKSDENDAIAMANALIALAKGE